MIFFLFFDLWRKNNEAGNFLNAVEREPVQTRVLNPTVSEASYKRKQRSYRKTKLKKKVLAPDSPGAEMSGTEMSSAETPAPKRRRRNGGAETYPTPYFHVVNILLTESHRSPVISTLYLYFQKTLFAHRVNDHLHTIILFMFNPME